MADISFDDLIPTKQQSRATTESNVSFDDLVPKDAGALSAFGSGAATGVVPGLTGLAGFGAGMKASVPVALRAAAAFPVPHPLAKAAVGGGVALLGGLVGAGIGSSVFSVAQDMLYELVDPEGYAKNKLAQAQHPTAYGVGNIVGSSVGMSPKVLPQIVGRVFSKPVVQRGTSAVLGGGINVAQQAMTKDHIDWTEAAAATGVGAALPSFNRLGSAAFRAGERLVPVSRRPIEMGIGPRDPELEVAPDIASRPPESPIPAKTAEATGRIDANLREAELSTDPGKRLKEAAFRDTSNDTIIPQGKGHDDLLKTDPRLERGYLTEDNTFVTPQEAKIIAENQHSDLLTKGVDPKEGFHSTDFGPERMDALKGKDFATFDSSAVQKEDDLYRKYQEIRQQHEDALASPDKYSKEQVEALNQQRLSVRDELLVAKLASIKNPVLRKMALEASTNDPVALNSNNISNVGELVSYLKGKFGDNHYISQLLDVLNVDPNTNSFILSAAEFKFQAQKYGMNPDSPAFWNARGIFIAENRGTNAIVVAHEIGHAALSFKIEQIRALPADHPDAVRLNKLVDNIENILTDAKSKIDLDKLSISSRSQIEYALSDVHEFISDGIFNPTVMQELLAIDRAAPKLGLVDKILKAVSDFLGLDSKQHTALHDLIESVGKLSEADVPKNLDPPNLFTKGMKESEDIQRDVGKTGIAATHDSPHRFDGIFDWPLHVGKGQGAAAKGIGTYLSTANDVHGSYKREFTDTIDDQRADAEGYKLKFDLFNTQTLTKDKDNAAFMVWKAIKKEEKLFNFEKDRKNTRAEAIQGVKDELTSILRYYQNNPLQDSAINDIRNAYIVQRLKEIDKKRWAKAYEYLRPPTSKFDGGISPTYHVTINANPDHIMSWDIPLKDQSKYVQQKLNPWIDPASFAPIKWSKGADVDLAYYPGEKGETQKTYVYESKEPVEIVQVGRAGDVDDAIVYTIKIPKSLEHIYTNTGEVFSSIKEAQEEFAKMHKSSFDITPETTAGRLYEFAVSAFEKAAKGEDIDIAHREAQVKASILFLNTGIVGHRFNSSGGQNAKYPNYVIFKDSVIETNAVTFRDLPKSRAASPEEAIAPAKVDPKRYDPRNVVDEADLKIKGKELYAAEGADAARKFFTDYETYRDTWLNPVKEVEDFVEININNKMADERIVINNSNVLKALVPDAVAREQVSIAIDAKNTKSLTGAAKEAADKYTGWMKDIGERALKEGVVKGLLENYVTHIVNWKDLPKGALDTFLADVFGKKFEGEPSGMTPESRFGKERTVETFHQLDLALKYINERIEAAGKSDFRLEVKTKDIAEIYKQYASSMEKAIENKKLVDSVRQIRNVTGESLIRRVTEEDPLPRGWTIIDDRQFAGFAVHPDLAPALKFAFEAKGGQVLNALYNVSQVTKRLNVVGSLFHAKSLMEVLNSTHTPIVTPIKEITLGITDKLLGTEFSGIRKAVNEFKRGGLGSSVDKWQRAGLVLETPSDVSKGVIADTGKFADSMISKFGPKTHILESALTAIEKYTLGIFDKVTWDYLHTGGKLMTAEAYLTKAREQATKDGVPFDEAASRKEITSFINKSFGGLNWFQEARSAETEFGKRMAMAAYSPEGRKALQIMLFAPDWTISTIKAFTSALPKGFNPTKWHPIEGVKGMGTPSTQADYARLYQFKTALTYLTLINGINLITANHPIWDNKDPTRIEWPDGTSMQAMKHAMEPYHWLADPTKTLSNKLGFVPKAAVIGLTGSEYASPSAPKLVDPSLANRAIAIGKQALPFQVTAAMSAPEGEGAKRALLGTIGLPLYGQTVEQRKIARKERSEAVRVQREKHRERERTRANQ